jgi:hypothetical protein
MCSTVTVYRSACTVPLLYIGLHVKYRYSRQVLIKSDFSGQIFENTQIKFHENPSTSSRDKT